MSVDEMKKKAHDLIDKQNSTQKLEKVLEILVKNEKREMSAQEVFDWAVANYGNTLQKLAQ